jgi:hypothetical protein
MPYEDRVIVTNVLSASFYPAFLHTQLIAL